MNGREKEETKKKERKRKKKPLSYSPGKKARMNATALQDEFLEKRMCEGEGRKKEREWA